MKTEKSIQFLSNNRKLIAGPCKKQFFLSFHLFYYIHTPVPPLSQANQSDGNSVAREVEFDHHLTTSSSQPVPCIVFYVPTFFYNHHKQRRKLCILHNFRRFIMLFSRTSQFSDPEGQRFEFSRSHQEQHLMGCCSFCFAWILWSSKRGGFEQPVPRALRPAGQKRPDGAFLGRGLANPFRRTRKHYCDVFFAMRSFFFDFLE